MSKKYKNFVDYIANLHPNRDSSDEVCKTITSYIKQYPENAPFKRATYYSFDRTSVKSMTVLDFAIQKRRESKIPAHETFWRAIMDLLKDHGFLRKKGRGAQRIEDSVIDFKPNDENASKFRDQLNANLASLGKKPAIKNKKFPVLIGQGKQHLTLLDFAIRQCNRAKKNKEEEEQENAWREVAIALKDNDFEHKNSFLSILIPSKKAEEKKPEPAPEKKIELLNKDLARLIARSNPKDAKITEITNKVYDLTEDGASFSEATWRGKPLQSFIMKKLEKSSKDEFLTDHDFWIEVKQLMDLFMENETKKTAEEEMETELDEIYQSVKNEKKKKNTIQTPAYTYNDGDSDPEFKELELSDLTKSDRRRAGRSQSDADDIYHGRGDDEDDLHRGR